MIRLPSYPKIWAMGSLPAADLLTADVVIQEKIDGSQFSFGLIDGEFMARSKGAELYVGNINKLFTKAVTHVMGLDLTPGIVYRGECLNTPSHNALCYNRVPKGNVILFDAYNIATQRYMSQTEFLKEAERLKLETVPDFWHGPGAEVNMELIKKLMNTESILGGTKIEGIVIKNYSTYGKDGNPIFAKYVSEAFKEIHRYEFRKKNPTGGDVIQLLGSKYKTPARWQKAVQHLAEKGELTSTPKDIGVLMKEVQLDVLAECTDEIKEELFKFAWPKISRIIAVGLPQWYKEELLKKQLNETSDEESSN